MSGAIIITYEESGTVDTASRHRHNGYSSGFSTRAGQWTTTAGRPAPPRRVHGRRDPACPDRAGSTHLLAANLAVLPARPGNSAPDAETTYAHRDRRAIFHTLVAANL